MASRTPSTPSSNRDSAWVAGPLRTIAPYSPGCSPNVPSVRRNFGQRGPPNGSLSDMMERNPPLTSILTTSRTSMPTRSNGTDDLKITIPDPLDALAFCSRIPDSTAPPETALPAGEGFSHLVAPNFLQQSVTTQLTSVPGPAEAPQHPATRTASSREKKAFNDAQSLAELKDPPPGWKPDYSWPTLIRCAIFSHPKRCPTLSEIYDLIENRFSFYKSDDTRWKGAVRHYLSKHTSFVKIPRPLTEPGKGNYWMYDPKPPNKDNRRKTRTKRKPNRDGDLSTRADDSDNSGRVHRLPRSSESPPFAPSGRHSHGYSPSAYVREQDVVSRHESPTRVAPESRSLDAATSPEQSQRYPAAFDLSVSSIEGRSPSSAVSYPTTGDAMALTRSVPAALLSHNGGSDPARGAGGEQIQDHLLSSLPSFTATWTLDEFSLPASTDYRHGGGSRILQSMSGFQLQFLNDMHPGYLTFHKLPHIPSTSSMGTDTLQYRYGGSEPFSQP